MTRKLFSRKYTKRTRFTRQCIGEAIIALVYKKTLIPLPSPTL